MDEFFNDQVRERDKQTPELWKPTDETEQQRHDIFTDKELIAFTKQLLKKVAAKWAPEYGLSERDFVIRLDGEANRNVEIKSGVIIRVYFSVLPYDDEFEKILRRTLSFVRSIKRERLPVVRTWFLEERKRWKIAKLTSKIEIPKEQTDVQILYKVIVKHRSTGICSVKEGLQSKYSATRLIAMAREELIDLVEAAKPLLEKVKEVEQMITAPEENLKFDDFSTQLQVEDVYSDEKLGITEYDDKI